MAACAVKEKSVLMTPDPYHTPGYGGFCPQFKYQIGETFGRTTSRLLRDSNVSSSGRLVLAGTQPGVVTEKDEIQTQRMELIKTRTQSWGDQKLMAKMVPGYTGFIPKSQHYFGKRYADNCQSAISDFENDQRGQNAKHEEMAAIEGLQTGRLAKSANDITLPKIHSKYRTPLTPQAKESKPYISAHAKQHTMSPFYMVNTNPDKKFMSGYTGFVPRARGKLGMGYPLITHMALNEFTDDNALHKQNEQAPFQIYRDDNVQGTSAKIYPVESGLVPHYTGHIPGEKFRYGHTFGFSTRNSLMKGQSVA